MKGFVAKETAVSCQWGSDRGKLIITQVDVKVENIWPEIHFNLQHVCLQGFRIKERILWSTLNVEELCWGFFHIWSNSGNKDSPRWQTCPRQSSAHDIVNAFSAARKVSKGELLPFLSTKTEIRQKINLKLQQFKLFCLLVIAKLISFLAYRHNFSMDINMQNSTGEKSFPFSHFSSWALCFYFCLFIYLFKILKKTTTLLNLQNMFRQKLLSSSVDRFTKR